MFALERIRLIRNYLQERKQVEVNSLSKLLDVSEVTIRRDLEKLEKDGILIRTHGGAVPVDRSGDLEGPFDNGDDKVAPDPHHTLQRLAYPLGLAGGQLPLDPTQESQGDIGRTAAHLVMDGEAVMILSGPLCRALAKALRDRKRLTVLTNDLIVAADMARSGRNRIVVLGGDLNGDDLAIYGAVAADDIRRFQVDRLFAQVDGFGRTFELSVRTQEQALLIREGRGRANEFVVLCEGAAFGKDAFFSFGSAKSGDTIVTDRSLPDSDKQRVFDANLRLFTAVDIYEGAEQG